LINQKRRLSFLAASNQVVLTRQKDPIPEKPSIQADTTKLRP